MKIIRAKHLGMCFGVRDAIDLAKRTAAHSPVTILGQLAHNEHVLNDLRQHGIRFATDPATVATATVMITAHGASDNRMNSVRASGRRVIEATCPLVQQAHRELRMLLLAGFHPVIIGRPDHVEVRGMTEDLDSFDVIQNESEVDLLSLRPRFGVVAQTTQPIDRVNMLVSRIREKFSDSEVVFMDTVCRPTKDRQTAAVNLAQQCTVMVVIGGRNSNNTRELVATCETFCERVHHIEGAEELKLSWFNGDDVVGITAGTSTPDEIIDEVETSLKAIESGRDGKEFQPSPVLAGPAPAHRRSERLGSTTNSENPRTARPLMVKA